MEKLIDLHTHSNYSDGSMTPAELVNYAKSKGLYAISLTDHDTVGGVEEAVCEGRKIGLEVIRGIEFSVKSDTETHILGYFIDTKNRYLNDALFEIQKIRRERNAETEKMLQKLGFDITLDEVLKSTQSKVIGRAHFARIMMEKGYVSSVKEAFDKYLSYGSGAYSTKQYLDARGAIEIIKKAGGKSFAAHLHLNKKEDDDLFDFLKELKNYGLDGIEGYYTDYTEKMQNTYHNMAKKLDLLLSGGTDFHAKNKPHIEIGVGYGNLKIPYSLIEHMKYNKFI